MRRAFVYKDEKSDKFWRIEQLGTDLAVNYGKTGAVGKYEIKEFDDEAEALKQAEKLVAQKLKKGYLETANFDYDGHFYFDDDEVGLHPLTSHPNFRAHFTDGLYYDCCDEEAPFGSDEGSDTLYIMEETLRKKPGFNLADFPRYLIEKEWDMTYLPVDSLAEDEVARLLETDEMNVIQSDMVTYAAAFGQIKVTGKINAALKEAALSALERLHITAKVQEWGDGGRSPILDKLIHDLTAFKGV